MKLAAILSTTVLPVDGLYKIKTVAKEDLPSLMGVPHYIGHPATQAIVESMGAVKAPTNLFSGLQEGEYALAVSIKQGLSSRKEVGFTTPHQDVTIDDLCFRIIYRIPEEN